MEVMALIGITAIASFCAFVSAFYAWSLTPWRHRRHHWAEAMELTVAAAVFAVVWAGAVYLAF